MRDPAPATEAAALLAPRRLAVQIVGFAAGAAMLVWIIRKAIGEGEWDRVLHAAPPLVAGLIACTLTSAAANGTIFFVTIRPIQRIGFWDLQRLNVVATLLNYAPIRLGAVARVLYHLRVDRLGLLQIGAWFSLVGGVMILGVASCGLATIVRPEVDWLWALLVAGQLLLGGGAIRILGSLPLVARHGRGIDRMTIDRWSVWGAIALRAIDLAAFAGRMALAAAILQIAAFAGRMALAAAILQIHLEARHVVLLALVAVTASLIPFGRVGFREFCVAMAAERLGMLVGDVEANMNQLALIESAGEVMVFIPLGLLGLGWFRKRWRKGQEENNLEERRPPAEQRGSGFGVRESNEP